MGGRGGQVPRVGALALAATVALLLHGCTVTAPASSAAPASENLDVEIVNRASQTILSVHLSPQGSGAWGQDRLPGTIAAGARSRVELPRDGQCRYDVRVVYADKSSEERRRQDLCETSQLVFSGGATTAVPSSGSSNADFDVVNRSSKVIINVFVSPQESDKWGTDRLPGTIAPGARFSVKMPRDGRCQYDVRVVYADKTSEDRRRQNLCATSELAFSGATGSSTKPASGNADFDVVNRSSKVIINVFVSPQESDKWGTDRLPGTITAGARYSVKMPRDGVCQYDVRIVYADKTTEERRRQNLCATSEIVFSGSGSK